MLTIGVAIITFNEEENILKALQSAKFANDIVVVDSGSTDKTEEIVKKEQVRFLYKKWEGFGEQKQFACDNLDVDVILILDADEWITKECMLEITNLLKNGFNESGFRVPIYHIFMGKIIYYGKGVAYNLRLFKKKEGKFIPRPVHETIKLVGGTGQLKEGLIHNSSPTIRSKLKKIKRDTDLELICHDRQPIGLKDVLYIPIKYFFFNLIKRKGYKDGIIGIIWLGLFSWQLFYQHWSFLKNPKRPHNL